MATKSRFSKAAALAALIARCSDIERVNGFNPDNGWSQVDGASTERCVEYGRFSMLQDLIEDLEGGYLP